MKIATSSLILSFLLVLMISPLLSTYADDDTTKGDFAVDTVNDTPIFMAWFDSVEILPAQQDQLFFATILDVDNDSTELTVTLYYSSDGFSGENISQALSYFEAPDVNQYNFSWIFPGQTEGTYYEYYYQVEDGYSRVKKPTSGYYDIQWGIVGGPRDPNAMDFFLIYFLNNIALSLFQFVFALISFIIIIIVIIKILYK